MLKKFEVKNYKNFKEKLSIDFSKVGGYQFNMDCISDQMLGKMLIYGKNATGKTNLGKAISDIRSILLPTMYEENTAFLNGDSEESSAEFTYYFRFGNDDVKYSYLKKDAVQLCYESLAVNGKELFSSHISDGGAVFDADDAIQQVNVNRYLEIYEERDDAGRVRVIPFLRWLINNTALNEDSILLKVYDAVRGMFFIPLQSYTGFGMGQIGGEFFKTLEDEENLKDFEDFLNVMGVQCQLELQKLPDGTAELYFKHDKLLPFFYTASSGTRALVSMYQRFYNLKNVSFLYIDEFDAFYHYEMSENMIAFLKKKYPQSQIILTTHNTNLMTNRIMRPDCLFILSTAGTLTPLNAATMRELREGHNLEKMYISGEFAAHE